MRNKRCMAFAFAFIFAFIALAVPRSAFAYEYTAYTIFQDEWYEDGDIDPTQGWIIYANNKYDAALYVCGDNVSSLTNEQLNYLSDINYGGAFYSLAQKFGTGFEHEWIPDYVRPMLALVDFDKVQVGTATTYEISQAKARLQEVMNGDVGTGGGTEEEGKSPVFEITLSANGVRVMEQNSNFATTSFNYDGTRVYVNDCYLQSNTSNTHSKTAPNVINIKLDDNSNNKYQALLANHPNLKLYMSSRVSGAKLALKLIASESEPNTSTFNTTTFGTTYTSTKYSFGRCYVIAQGEFRQTNGENIFYSNGWSFSENSSYTVDYPESNGRNSYFGTTVGATAPEPEGDWPSAPVEPTPPELPTPTNPTVPVEPEPTIPEPTIPSDPIYIPVEAPDSTDYTDWLRAILSALNKIDSEIVTLSTNLGDYFAAVNQYLVRLIQDITTHCDHLQTAMNTEFTSLKSYLQELFTWLGEQMQFNFEGYDDTSIISWLRKIYGRLGGGTYKPNPDADPKTFLDWLLEQWNRFFTSLLEKLPDAIGDLVNDFQQLTRFFPFSIPWDLAALLGLFAHAPVTPVFDIPLPFGAGSGYTTNIHIDCTPWDGMAAMVRPCFLAMFCLQLALLTRDLLKGLNVTGGDE